MGFNEVSLFTTWTGIGTKYRSNIKVNAAYKDIYKDGSTFTTGTQAIGHFQDWATNPFIGIPFHLKIRSVNEGLSVGVSFGVKQKLKPDANFVYDFTKLSAGITGTLVGSFRWVRWDEDFLDYTDAPV